jgi:hypothetical protein
MALPVVFRKAVGQDLAGAYRWYEQHGSGLGSRFLDPVDRCFDDVQSHPELFARVNSEVRRASVSRFPYSVFLSGRSQANRGAGRSSFGARPEVLATGATHVALIRLGSGPG